MKIKLKHSIAEALVQLLEAHIAKPWETDDDKLLMAALAEISHRLRKKMIDYQVQYSVKLTPVQAISLRIFYVDFITGAAENTYLGNWLRSVADAAHQTYNV